MKFFSFSKKPAFVVTKDGTLQETNVSKKNFLANVASFATSFIGGCATGYATAFLPYVAGPISYVLINAAARGFFFYLGKETGEQLHSKPHAKAPFVSALVGLTASVFAAPFLPSLKLDFNENAQEKVKTEQVQNAVPANTKAFVTYSAKM